MFVTELCVLQVMLMVMTVQGAPNVWMKALRFARESVIAPKITRTLQNIPFNPDDGLRYRRSYQQFYGVRGTRLVDLFGQGLEREQLIRMGAVSN